MKDPKNLTISLLCVSAAILATALLLAHVTAGDARADVPVRVGDYIMVTASASTTVDLVYVIDMAVNKINVYSYIDGRNELRLWDQGNLQLIFRPAAP